MKKIITYYGIFVLHILHDYGPSLRHVDSLPLLLLTPIYQRLLHTNINAKEKYKYKNIYILKSYSISIIIK